MVHKNGDFDPKKIAHEVLKALKSISQEATISQAYEVLATSHGYSTWNHMSAEFKKSEELHSPPASIIRMPPKNWPLKHKFGIHLIVCRDTVSTEMAADHAIDSLISSKEARTLISDGYFWRMNFFMPENLFVTTISPNPKEHIMAFMDLTTYVLVHTHRPKMKFGMFTLNGRM